MGKVEDGFTFRAHHLDADEAQQLALHLKRVRTRRKTAQVVRKKFWTDENNKLHIKEESLDSSDLAGKNRDMLEKQLEGSDLKIVFSRSFKGAKEPEPVELDPILLYLISREKEDTEQDYKNRLTIAFVNFLEDDSALYVWFPSEDDPTPADGLMNKDTFPTDIQSPMLVKWVNIFAKQAEISFVYKREATQGIPQTKQ